MHSYKQTEVTLKGANRLGIDPVGRDMLNMFGPVLRRCRDRKRYELRNHLGNVLAVITDRKFAKGGGGNQVSYYKAQTIVGADYFPYGQLHPGRYVDLRDYRYGYNGKEREERGEFGTLTHYDYGFRVYSPGLGRFWSVDPKAAEYAGWSGYVYVMGNPVRFIDPDGRLPILPMIFKAGANAAADWFMQTAMNYYFNPETAGDWEKSMTEVNGWQILRSGLEGLIPWKTPGGRLGRAALTATGDVMVNWAHRGSAYTTEQAVEDFAVGFVSDLGGGELGVLINKYGGKAVAKGFQRLGLDVPEQVLQSIEKGLLEETFTDSRNITFTRKQLQRKYYHAKVFGVSGGYNPTNAEKFQSVIEAHINDVNTIVIQGTYRKTIKGTHYYNPKTRLWVFKNADGQFLTGWRLGINQRQDLLINSNVQ